MSQHAKVLREILGKKAVAFYPTFAKALGSIPAAVMLSYLIGELERLNQDSKRITSDEWYNATGLTYEAQMHARSILSKTGFWKQKRMGIPAAVFFAIDRDELTRFVEKYQNSTNEPAYLSRSTFGFQKSFFQQKKCFWGK